MTQSEHLLTSTQAGQILGKSGRTVSRLAMKGLLVPAQTLPIGNGAYLFRQSDVIAYRDQRAPAA